MIRYICMFANTTKHLTAYLAFGLCFSLFFTTNARAAENLPPDMARIFDQGKIVVAMYFEDFPPFFMKNKQGQMYGFDVELAFDIGRKLGVDVIFKREAGTYEDVVAMVANRKADIGISAISRTRSRAIKVIFTKPYITLYHAMLINRLKTSQMKPGTEWLNSMNVALGVVTGTSYVEFAQHDYPNAQIVQYSKWEQAAQDALKGKIHAAFYDDISVLEWVNEHPEEALYVKAEILKNKEAPLSIAVHWEDRHLLSWLNLYIQSITLEGTLDKLIEFYLKGNEWKRKD